VSDQSQWGHPKSEHRANWAARLGWKCSTPPVPSTSRPWSGQGTSSGVITFSTDEHLRAHSDFFPSAMASERSQLAARELTDSFSALTGTIPPGPHGSRRQRPRARSTARTQQQRSGTARALRPAARGQASTPSRPGPGVAGAATRPRSRPRPGGRRHAAPVGRPAGNRDGSAPVAPRAGSDEQASLQRSQRQRSAGARSAARREF
jgi:hypothetical protein